MPEGKPAGVRCVQLTDENLCELFGSPLRPRVCAAFRPTEDVCGDCQSEALVLLERLERATSPVT
jgi:hypothetical protein